MNNRLKMTKYLSLNQNKFKLLDIKVINLKSMNIIRSKSKINKLKAFKMKIKFQSMLFKITPRTQILNKVTFIEKKGMFK